LLHFAVSRLFGVIIDDDNNDDDNYYFVVVVCCECRFEIKEEDGKQTLIIKDLKLDDAADFVCKIGDRETSAKLQVDEGMQKS